MKTIQELYKEVLVDEELKAKCIEAANARKMEAFLKEQDCDATVEQVVSYLKAKEEQEDAPLSLDELDNAAGGDCERTNDTVFSACTGGAGCLIALTISMGKNKMTDAIVEVKEDKKYLCN